MSIVQSSPLPLHFHTVIYRLTLLITLFLIGNITSAQYLQPSFKNYTVDDGLPSSEVHKVVQDHDGYMWFGTDNGLSRFDGYEFKNYGTKEGLLNPVIFDMFVDDDGKLWVLTMSGNIYIHHEGKIKPYKFNHLITKQKRYYQYATRFHRDTDGLIYIALYGFNIISISTSGKYLSLDTKRDKTQIIIREFAKKVLYSSNTLNINPTVSSLEIEIVVIGKDTTRYFINDSTDKTQTVRTFKALKTNNNSITIYTSNNTFEIVNYQLYLKERTKSTLNCIFKNTDNTSWLGYDQNNGIQVISNTKYDSTQILAGKSISDIYKDKQNNIWTTTINNGIYFHSQGDLLNLSKPLRSSKFDVRSLTIKNKHQIFLGLFNGEIYNLNLNTANIKNLFSPNNVESAGYHDLGTLYYSKATDILFGGSNANIWNNSKLFFISFKKKSQKALTISQTSSKELNNQLLINSSSGTFLIDLKNRSIVDNIRNTKKPTTCNFGTAGEKYIGRVDGLWQWIGDTLIRPINCHPHMEERIEAIEFLSNENFVLGTKGRGILIWNQEKIITQITETDGLSSDMIENVFIDSLDQIWVGTLNGLNRIRFQNDSTYQIKQFTKKHGLPGNEINKVRRQGEYIWVATTTGLGRIQDTEPDSTTTTPLINNFRINGTNIQPEEVQQLNYEQDNITIEFVSLDYKAQGDIKYRYRLQSNQDWQETKTRILNFPNLSPSLYKLEIQAQNEDGFWSQSAIQTFTITPPFWKQIWFLILAGLIIIGSTLLYFKRRQQQAIDTIKEEHNVQSQIVDLERSALQAQMNPHFIFNILNSIQLSINQNENETASQILAKFAKLIRATLKNATSKSITLEEEINYISSYLHLEQIRHKKEAFQYQVNHSEDIDTSSIMLPPMLIQPYVENAVKHGTRNTQSAMIKVRYTIDNQDLNVTIEDNGPGITATNSISQHKSMGMDITKRRLDLLNIDAKDSYFQIHQLLDSTGKVSGTKIELIIKCDTFTPPSSL